MLVSIVFGSNTKCQEKLSTALAFPNYAHCSMSCSTLGHQNSTKKSYLMTKILLCDTMNNYGKLLDEIFNVKFIERAIQVKAIVDCQIMAIHPHMGMIIAYYDLLIYRYYSPVWNRNGEGQLQVLEEEEEEEEEEKDDDDGDGDDDKKNWIEVD